MGDKFRMAQEQVSHSDDSDGESQSDLSDGDLGDESISQTPGPVLGLLVNCQSCYGSPLIVCIVIRPSYKLDNLLLERSCQIMAVKS